MAEAAASVAPIASNSLSRETSLPETRPAQAFVQKLPTYEGHQNKSDILNKGDANGIKYAVPFQLRSGSQSSEFNGSQIAFSVDQQHPDRFLIAEDNRQVNDQSVVLEQWGGQLFLKRGNNSQEVHQGNMARAFLSREDFNRNSLVVPMNSDFSLSVVGFDPDKHQVIVQKVRPSKSQPITTPQLAGPPPKEVTVSGIGTYQSPAKVNLEYQWAKDFPEVQNISSFDQIRIVGPSDRTPTPTPIPTIKEPLPDSKITIPKFPNVISTTPSEQVPVQPTQTTEVKAAEAPTTEAKLPEVKTARERGELLRRINVLKNTEWGAGLVATLGAVGLMALLSWAVDRATGLQSIPNTRPTPIGFGPTQEPVPTRVPDAVIRPRVIPNTVETKIPPKEPEPATVLETNLRNQSTWGVFLHHLGRLDASAVESAFPGGIPDNLRAAWNAVRELEGQTGQFVKPDNPKLLEAVDAATQFMGKSNVEKLYGNFLADIKKDNPDATASLVDATFKTDSRFGTSITDSRITADTMKMRPLEDVVKDTFAPKQGSVQT